MGYTGMPATGREVSGQGQAARFLLLRAGGQVVAVECQRVLELVVGVEVTSVPNTAGWMAGVFNWRGKILPCIDLRLRLGLSSWKEEISGLAGTMAARAADHLEWIEELLRSVEERRPFTKTTDPHACAFGKWYDRFVSENLIVQAVLKKMDAPHKAIHALAIQVEQLKSEGRFEQAERIIAEARQTTLARLLKLMEQFEEAIWEMYRPVIAVINDEPAPAGLLTDGIEAVEWMDTASTAPLEEIGIENHSGLIRKLLRRGSGAMAGWLERGRLLAA